MGTQSQLYLWTRDLAVTQALAQKDPTPNLMLVVSVLGVLRSFVQRATSKSCSGPLGSWSQQSCPRRRLTFCLCVRPGCVYQHSRSGFKRAPLGSECAKITEVLLKIMPVREKISHAPVAFGFPWCVTLLAKPGSLPSQLNLEVFQFNPSPLRRRLTPGTQLGQLFVVCLFSCVGCKSPPRSLQQSEEGWVSVSKQLCFSFS